MINRLPQPLYINSKERDRVFPEADHSQRTENISFDIHRRSLELVDHFWTEGNCQLSVNDLPACDTD